ncbi:Hypothetical predicted protein [Mytilus galloprovincialis]|uniref:Uncharacterized protein n=1 Tax=Mytilus galloprovincialis TaxID=29158 RepID=A0A8B6DST1_MYTGA|nr:Hypothetical predicted protein [Mytilus galloprovincialis]
METEENIGGACIFSPATSTSRITTRSEWYSCIFCKNTTYKKDAKLHKVESEDRIKNILEAARNNSDHEIESTDYDDKYTTYKLQKRLMNYYGDSIVIQPQQGQGKSNIMFSSSISIGDAIKAASQLKSELKIAQLDLEIGSSKNTTSEEQILHTAANILRRDIHSLDLNNDYYPTPSECSLPL